MKKIFVLITLTLMFSLLFIPQVNAEENDYDELNKEVLELLERTKTDYHYNFLSTTENGPIQQEIYKVIGEFCTNIITNYKTDVDSRQEVKLSKEVAECALKYWGSVNPDGSVIVFVSDPYALSAYRRDYPMNYIASQLGIIVRGSSNEGVIATFYLADDYTSKDVRYDINKKLCKKIREFGSYADGIESEYTKARIFNKLICDNMYYEWEDEENKIFSQKTYAHNLLGLFIYGKGVCETYAYAFSTLMNYAGGECYYVNGNATNNDYGHAWNIAKMNNGEWYWFDIDANDDDKNGKEQNRFLCYKNDLYTLDEYCGTDRRFSLDSVPPRATSMDDPAEWYCVEVDGVVYKLNYSIAIVKENKYQKPVPEKIVLSFGTFNTLCNHNKTEPKDNCTVCLDCTVMLHNIVNVKAEYATCTKDGLTMGRKCSECGYVELEQEVIPKKGHDETDWIIDVQPSNKENGHKYKMCLTCSEITEEEVIPKLGPSIEDFIIPISIGVGCLVFGSIVIVFIMKAKKKKKLN